MKKKSQKTSKKKSTLKKVDVTDSIAHRILEKVMVIKDSLPVIGKKKSSQKTSSKKTAKKSVVRKKK